MGETNTLFHSVVNQNRVNRGCCGDTEEEYPAQAGGGASIGQ